MKHLLPAPLCRTQRGATLIEVLIAMLIMAIGLLGMASMTAASIQYNQLARMRGVGASLVNDYTERLRANTVGFDLGGYDNCAAGADGKCTKKYGDTAYSAPAGCTKQAPCIHKTLAAYDRSEWLLSVAQRLPGGDALVRTNFTAANIGADRFRDRERTADIWLMWTEPVRENDVGVTDAQQCPAEVKGGAKDSDGLRCMFFRVSL